MNSLEIVGSGGLFLAWPLALLALPLPLLVYRLAPRARDATTGALRLPATLAWAHAGDASAERSMRRWFGLLILALFWVALVVALARPQSLGEPLGTPLGGRDLMLGIDISGSMRENDLYAGNTRASRMAVVRQVARDFVARREGDRIGLIMFGSEAYVQTPLTTDHATVQHFLEQATVGLAGRSTAIGDAIGLAVKRLREREADARVMILLTDGANSAGVVEPLAAARLARDNGIRIHTIGVGAEARPLSSLERAFGNRRAELDEETLSGVAEMTGGAYYRARDAAELERIYREIDALEPSDEEHEDFRPLLERYPWPLGVALALSVVLALLRLDPTDFRARV